MSEANEGMPEGISEDTTVADLVADDTPETGSGDDAAASTDEGQAEKPKPKQSVQDRINELTAARREAERDRDFYREQALRQQQAQPAPEAQVTPQGDGRPDRADYDDDFAYIEDLTDWKAAQAAGQYAQRATMQARQQQVVETYHSRVATLYPNGKPAGLAAFERIAVVPEAVNEVIGASDIGPRIAAHLGDNPAELVRLERLNPVQQARELTLLEMRLSQPGRPTPKTATDAPEPIPQARGSGGKFAVQADTNDFASFEKAFREKL